MSKEANLICGDAIVNYRTVQSFGNEELVVKKYEELLKPAHDKTIRYTIATGFAFGLSQFTQYAVFACMFWSAGEIIKNNIIVNSENGEVTLGVNPSDVFTALFAIMFGASHMGSAAAFGPDMGKAMAAAKRIFKIKEHPSSIDAVQMDEQNTKKRLNFESIKGKIEFRNVWFRYPTRKEDFVHRDLNIIINPGETVALVGESGCGKSTFVNLLMRFYDIDSGEILLDDVNIKDINLHDLRNAISLVMQEPLIFNYTILENILYGKSNASNSEVMFASVQANAMEFIEQNSLFNIDESARSLITEMEKYKDQITTLIGNEKYEEEMQVLTKIDE